jgi:hypothetical protein
MEKGDAARLKQLEDENGRLKKLVGDQALATRILKELPGKDSYTAGSRRCKCDRSRSEKRCQRCSGRPDSGASPPPRRSRSRRPLIRAIRSGAPSMRRSFCFTFFSRLELKPYSRAQISHVARCSRASRDSSGESSRSIQSSSRSKICSQVKRVNLSILFTHSVFGRVRPLGRGPRRSATTVAAAVRDRDGDDYEWSRPDSPPHPRSADTSGLPTSPTA